MKQTGKFHVYEIKDDKRVVSAIANATLYFLDVNDQEQFKLTTNTDNEGNFNFDLAVGEYVVLATAGDGLEQVLANGSTFKITAQSEVSAFEEWLNNPSASVDSSLLAKFRELMQRTEAAAERSENASQIVDTNLEENLNKLSERTNAGLSALTIEKNSSIQEIRDTTASSKSELQTAVDSAKTTQTKLEQTASESVKTINDTKDSAESSINTTKQQATKSIEQSKLDAESSIHSAKDSALQAVVTERESSVDAVNTAKSNAISEIDGKIDGLATTDYVDDAVGSVDLSNYATKEELNSAGGLPVGHIYWNIRHDNGSLLCNGQEVSRATYKDLWESVKDIAVTQAVWTEENNKGMTGLYSVGNGTTTFRLPNIPTYIRGGDAGIQEAGLPNITGGVGIRSTFINDVDTYDGALLSSPSSSNFQYTGNSSANRKYLDLKFDSSLSSPIYGKSNTVEVDSVRDYFQVKAFGRVENMGSIDADNIISEINKVNNDLTTSINEVSKAGMQYALVDFGTVERDKRYVKENPFGINTPVITVTEIFTQGVWTISGHYTESNLRSFTSGGFVQGEGLVVQTGQQLVCLYGRVSGQISSSKGSPDRLTSAPCRVHIWAIKG